ncbi:MAG TPA: tetratricopeptide repeat protein [Pyrinomonadaceae bacterium]
MNSWQSRWDSLSPDTKNLIINILAGVAVLIVGFIGFLLRRSIAVLWYRAFPRKTPDATPPHHVVIEVKQPAPPVAPEPEKITAPAPLPLLPSPPIVGFVARWDTEGHDILERLKDELAPEKRQLIVLCGAGGVGKTTLAAAAARSLSDAFMNRLAWVSADGRPEFSLSILLDEVAGQLGEDDTALRQSALQYKEEKVRAIVATAPTLVVLDNFETIAEAEQARCAGWLSHTPCSAAITSRDDIEQALPVNIHAMSLPEARIFVELLIKQARRPQAFNGLKHDDIIATADRNPLVLQWIVKQIDRAKQPRIVLQEFAQGKGDAAQRVFGRSYELLSEDSRAALLALSLFAPSATRESLAEVAGFGNDLKRLDEALAQAIELWLIGATEGNERLLIEGLTRELSKAHLARDKHRDEFRQRFVAHFMNYAKAHAQVTPEDFEALEAEKDNVLSAMDVAFELEDWATVVSMCFTLRDFLDLHGYWDEAIRSGKQALVAARSLQSESDIAGLAHNLAMIHQNRGKLDTARELYNESLEINKKLGNQSIIAKTLHELGRLAQAQGEIEEARRLYDESLEINKKLGDQNTIAKTLHELGRLAQNQGEIEGARRLYDESLEIKKKLGDQSGIAITLHELGRLAQNQGEVKEARQLYNKSLEINKKLCNQSIIAITLYQLGRLTEEEGNSEEAERLFREALSIFEKLKSPYAEIARESLKRLGAEET